MPLDQAAIDKVVDSEALSLYQKVMFLGHVYGVHFPKRVHPVGGATRDVTDADKARRIRATLTLIGHRI